MAVNDTIRESDYNSIRNKVANVLGVGNIDSGWGQNLASSTVTEGTKVTVGQYTNLRYDIINSYRHIFGSDPVPVTVLEGGSIRFSAVDAPVTTYDTIANTIVSNRFTVAASQSATLNFAPVSTSWPGPYGSTWNSLISSTITVTFATANQARHFFNSGGLVRISASRTATTLVTTQATEWTTLLLAAGTKSFGGNTPTAGLPGSSNGQNWYRCTNSFQQWSSTTGSSPYGSNSLQIDARCVDQPENSTGSARILQLRVRFADNYTDPFEAVSPPPGDAVDGTFTVNVNLLYATGILSPSSQSFSVTLPTVSIAAPSP